MYVLGQPGAGKSATARLVRRAMRPGTTHLVGDDFKVYHPDYLRLLQEDPRNAGAAVRADYRAWFAEAEEHVRRQRGDALVEGAPGSVPEFLASVEPFHRAGYPVELVVLAVREADSRLATALRYARAQKLGINGRFASRAGHDQCFHVLTDITDLAVRHPAITAVTLVRRDGEALLRSERGSTQPAQALAADHRHPKDHILTRLGTAPSSQLVLQAPRGHPGRGPHQPVSRGCPNRQAVLPTQAADVVDLGGTSLALLRSGQATRRTSSLLRVNVSE